MTALRTGNVPRARLHARRELRHQRAARRHDLVEQGGVALGIRDVDAGAEHGDGAAARPHAIRCVERAAMRRRVDAERAAGDDVDAGGGERAASSRAGSSPRAVAARAPTRATALGPGSTSPRIHSGDGGSASACRRAG